MSIPITRTIRPLCRSCHGIQSMSIVASTSSRLISTTLSRNKRIARQKPFEIPVSKSGKNPVSHLLNPPIPPPSDYLPQPPPKPRELLRLLLQRLPEWMAADRTRTKLLAYGIPTDQLDSLLRIWRDAVNNSLGNLNDQSKISQALAKGGWDETTLLLSLAEEEFGKALEGAYLRRFLTFCTTSKSVPPNLQSHLHSILQTTDLTRLPFEGMNIPARTISRHFHLHVGPTNSGKTYNALKALSKAGRGAYAGPLRLLAHEVWERLNLGTVGDLNGNGRKCNLLTGEERRIVDPDAGLLSCTVEMLPLLGGIGSRGQGFDVVVIDEIQMLGDPQRGGAWTSAVLGVMAKEVHLCGDETTVELLQSLIGSLGGDTVTVHRYDRLTPLTVADESLDSNFNNVQPGDCIVTFSRTNIFAVKKMVESQAGKKCAVVYGALPPETRAEQARDFNDEHGRAEVLVASDAVGMGLNLKIKRMIFESLHKFNGKSEVPLALTQIKQIAGRAGRYGLHKSVVDPQSIAAPLSETQSETSIVAPDETPTPGGVVTTLHAADLPLLKSLLPLPLPPLPRAILDVPQESLLNLATLLPPNTSFESLLDHFASLAITPSKTLLNPQEHKYPLAKVVEPFRSQLSLSEMDLFTFSPVSTRDPKALGIFTNLITSYARTGKVSIYEILEPSQLLRQLYLVEVTLKSLPRLPTILGIGRQPLTPPILISSIPLLETLHKSLVLYIWLSFRLEINFPDREIAQDFKTRTEGVLDSCLERLPGLRNRKNSERSREIETLWAKEKRLKHLEDKKIRWKGWDDPLHAAKKAKWEGVAVLNKQDEVVEK